MLKVYSKVTQPHTFSDDSLLPIIIGSSLCYRVTLIVYLFCMLLFGHYTVSNSFVTYWTIAHQAPLSMVFPRQEYRSGLLFSS